jgi:hypothetical protein
MKRCEIWVIVLQEKHSAAHFQEAGVEASTYLQIAYFFMSLQSEDLRLKARADDSR